MIMKAETIYEVVKKLAGRINPVADASIDGGVLENVTELTAAITLVMQDIIYVSKSYDSRYGSEKKVGEEALSFVKDIYEMITDVHNFTEQ